MDKIPLYATEVVELFKNAHQRGYAFIAELFYLYDENVAEMFWKDQKLWYVFKKTVKRIDHMLKYDEKYERTLQNMQRCRGQYISNLRKFDWFEQFLWFWFNSTSTTSYSDEFDCIRFV